MDPGAHTIHVERRAQICAFEALLASSPLAHVGDTEWMPLTHRFGDGIYLREIRIPAGTLLTGKIHRHAHPVFLMEGTAQVFTEAGGYDTLQGPWCAISPRAVKRAIYAVTDCWWITVHVTASQDLEEIERQVIAPSYRALEEGR